MVKVLIYIRMEICILVSGGGGYQNGKGTLIFPDNTKIIGVWTKGLLNNQAITTFPNGERYVAKYKDGEEVGVGNRYSANGNLIAQNTPTIEPENIENKPKWSVDDIFRRLGAAGKAYNETMQRVDPQPTVCQLRQTSFGNWQMVCP